MHLQRVGRIADARRSDPTTHHGMSRADGLVLSRGDHDAAPGVLERGVIEVLTDVVLVRPHAPRTARARGPAA